MCTVLFGVMFGLSNYQQRDGARRARAARRETKEVLQVLLLTCPKAAFTASLSMPPGSFVEKSQP